MQNKICNFEKQRQVYESELKLQIKQKQDLEQQIQNIHSQHDTTRKNILQLKQQIKDMENEKINLNTKIQSQEKLFESQQKKFDEQLDQISQLRVEKEGLERELKNLKFVTKEQIKTYENNIIKMQQHFQLEITSLKATKTTFNMMQYEDLLAHHVRLSQKYEELRALHKKNQGVYQSVDKQFDKFNSQVKKLEAENKSLRFKIAQNYLLVMLFIAKIKSLQKDQKAKKKLQKNLTMRNDELLKDITRFKEEIAQLETSVDDKQREIVALNAMIEEQLLQITELKSQPPTSS